MASNESTAYPIMLSLGVDYVLVIFGGAIGYSGDDINKFLWMVRIAEGEWPTEVKVMYLFSFFCQLHCESPSLLNWHSEYVNASLISCWLL